MPESPVQQDTEDEVKDTYVIPPPKSAQELKELDKGDDALNRWKEKLIGKEGNETGSASGKLEFQGGTKMWEDVMYTACAYSSHEK